MGDHLIFIRQLQVLDKIKRLDNRQLTKIADVDPAHRYRQNFRLQPFPMTVRAGNRAHYLRNFIPHIVALRFAEAAFQIVENPFKRGSVAALPKLAAAFKLNDFPIRAIEKQRLDFLREFAERSVQAELIVLRQSLIIHLRNGTIRVIPSARLNCSVLNGKLLIRYDQIRVNLHKGSKPCTSRASAVRVVKGEHIRFQLFYADAMLRTGIIKRKE